MLNMHPTHMQLGCSQANSTGMLTQAAFIKKIKITVTVVTHHGHTDLQQEVLTHTGHTREGPLVSQGQDTAHIGPAGQHTANEVRQKSTYSTEMRGQTRQPEASLQSF